MEIFKEIENIYEVSNLGRVRNKKTGRILKGSFDTRYYKVGLQGKQYYVHRLIALHFIDNPDNLQFVDHINGIKTDNRIENLRWVTNQQNGMNSKISSNNTSGFAGVCFDKSRNKWRANITVNKTIHLGYFATAELANEVRLKYIADNNLTFFR